MNKIFEIGALGLLVSACASSAGGGSGGSGAGAGDQAGATQAVGGSGSGTAGSGSAGSGLGGSSLGSSSLGGSDTPGAGAGGLGGAAGHAGFGGAAGAGGGGQNGAAGGAATSAMKPCDIYAAASTPCVGAHSTVRALYAAYSGKLYQVRRASDKTTKDIPVLTAGGIADSAQQDTFCTGTTCTLSIIYDQSPEGNHLPVSPPVHWIPSGGKEADASAAKISLSGHMVYGVLFPADSTFTYRNNATKGVATGDQPEAMYMVVDGHRYNGRCCFDYGNVETTGNDDGVGTMETLNWSNITNWSKGAGNGPVGDG